MARIEGPGTAAGTRRPLSKYFARQLYDFQTGARHGLWSDLMKPVVAKLSDDDILDLAAYTASLKP